MADIKIQTTQNVDIRYKLAHIGDRILAALLDVLILVTAAVSILTEMPLS